MRGVAADAGGGGLMAELAEDVVERLKALCDAGDGLVEDEEFDDAVEQYWAALELLPEPKTHWEAATLILTSIGDAHHLAGEPEAARDALELALSCPGAADNGFVHLRLGQSLLEVGAKDRAAAELERAYRSAGSEIFEDEDPKYLAFLMTRMDAPPDGW